MENSAETVLEPIILNPTSAETTKSEKGKTPRFRTLRLMLAGWLLGNLILGSIIGLLTIYFIASTGLVRVPVLTNLMFKTPAKVETNADSLKSAQKKADQIASLAAGQSIPEITFTEAEINALLTENFEKTKTDIINPHLTLDSNNFVFTGNLSSTSAPIKVKGTINVDSGVFKLDILKTTFGQQTLPPLLTNNVIYTAFAKVGFDLQNTPIPARQVDLQVGQIILHDVTQVQ
ncbi:MAG: hypothetical protein Q8P13_02475 [bacterium]|nr:hypothetical protein [bacterium]